MKHYLMTRLKRNLKNLRGWRTDRKLVVFSVDDYANVRVDSASSLEKLERAGLPPASHFDHFDSVETRDDLEALFEVLNSVRDRKDRPAIFTAYAMSANPDFERILNDGESYYYETIPETFARLAADQPAAYEGAWALWREGLSAGLIKPQFHGREHLSIDLLERKLRNQSADLMINLRNRSMTSLGREPSLPGVGFTHAFGLHEASQLPRHREILRDGLRLFEKIWGFPSLTFTPPAQRIHPALYEDAERAGVLAIDKPLHCVRNLGNGAVQREINKTGRQRGSAHLTTVRNVVFEPSVDVWSDPVAHAMDEIAAAFRWKKPAIISSHRVNFCGHISEDNRKQGLQALRFLLERITTRWPEVEFVSADELITAMAQ